MTSTEEPISAVPPAAAGDPVQYRFVAVEHCNMCGAPASKLRVFGKRLSRSQGLRPRSRMGIAVTVVRCGECGLIFSNPQPVPLKIESHYDVAPEAYWKDAYFDDDPNYFCSAIAGYEELRSARGGETQVLDIGSGLGKAVVALRKAGYDAYGVEASPAFCAAARARTGIPEGKFILGAVEEVEFPPASFDLITFGAVLEHLRDPDGSLRAALRWLKPGGLIYVEVPSSRWMMHKLINTVYQMQGTDYVGNLSPMHPPFHLYEFSIDSFRAHGQRNGYELVKHCYYVCQTYAPRMISPLLSTIMKLTNSGMQLEVWLRKRAD